MMVISEEKEPLDFVPVFQKIMDYGNMFGRQTLLVSIQSPVLDSTELKAVLKLMVFGNTRVLMFLKINGDSELSQILLMLWSWKKIFHAWLLTIPPF